MGNENFHGLFGYERFIGGKTLSSSVFLKRLHLFEIEIELGLELGNLMNNFFGTPSS